MSLTRQIGLGSLVLGASVVLHVAVLGVGIQLIETLALSDLTGSGTVEWILLVLIGSGLVLFGHTVQVWLWSGMILYIGALKSFADAIYFSLVTTTTLGYGDITLGPRHRVFGAMASVSGLMTFGLSTAFLINLVSAILQRAP